MSPQTFHNSSIETRFWSKVRFLPNDCWEWTGAMRGGGYGSFGVDGVMVSAHRWAYEQAHGTIADGLTLDHLCRNRACVNHAHLEAVTLAENLRRGDHNQRRKTHCPQGHPYAGDNLAIDVGGARRCRQCHKVQVRRSERKRRAA